MDGNITIKDMLERFVKLRKNYKEEIRVKRLLELCVDNVKEVSINNSPMDIIEDVIANKSGQYSLVLNRFVESFSPGGYDAEQLTILTKNNIMKEVNEMKTIDEIKTIEEIEDLYEKIRIKAESLGYYIRTMSPIVEGVEYNLRKLICEAFENGKFTATVDSNSRLILTTEPNYVPTGTVESAYENVDFITLDKDDAKAIVECIEESIVKIDGSTCADVEVFGDKSISFERLYDRTVGELYPRVKK